jgi:Na+(H+)/acetate symporter ActP
VRRLRFRVAALGAMVIPALLALLAESVDISILVGWAFAIAASTFCPMFLLGVWWTRLSARGAAGGMLAGALLATAAIFTGLALGDQSTSVIGALLAQPALISVPVAFVVMIVVSLRSPAGAAASAASAEMLALHAPEGLGLRLAEDELDAPAVPSSVMI